MRFALLGDHSDGLDMAQALAESGRHALAVYCGPLAGLEALRRRGLEPPSVGDLEEVLADPAIEAVIVAGTSAVRAAQLRRALQSERHVLCVHPVAATPDAAYEAALLQADTGYALLPLLPEAEHPGLRRLAELARAWQGAAPPEAPAFDTIPPTRHRPADFPRVVEIERWAEEEILLDEGAEPRRPGLPGWEALRLIGGEVAEVFALTAAEELVEAEPLLLIGRFTSGGLWQATYLPGQAEPRYRLTLVLRAGRACLEFIGGWPGPARLNLTDANGVAHVEEWPAYHPWAALVGAFERAVVEAEVRRRRPAAPTEPAAEALTKPQPQLGWQDEVRALELDDAARRSAARRRSSTLEHVEATEEASFKGTMTLLGCGLVWLSLVMLILSLWLPWLLWAIVPVFALFLAMQALRWVAKPDVRGTKSETDEQDAA